MNWRIKLMTESNDGLLISSIGLQLTELVGLRTNWHAFVSLNPVWTVVWRAAEFRHMFDVYRRHHCYPDKHTQTAFCVSTKQYFFYFISVRGTTTPLNMLVTLNWLLVWFIDTKSYNVKYKCLLWIYLR